MGKKHTFTVIYYVLFKINITVISKKTNRSTLILFKIKWPVIALYNLNCTPCFLIFQIPNSIPSLKIIKSGIISQALVGFIRTTEYLLFIDTPLSSNYFLHSWQINVEKNSIFMLQSE